MTQQTGVAVPPRRADHCTGDRLSVPIVEYPEEEERYQPVLFAADGLEHLLDVVGGFFAECDDDSPARLGTAAAARA